MIDLMSLRYFLRFLPCLLLVLSGFAAAATPPPPVAPFLERHCFECHDGDVAKAGLDLTTFPYDPSQTGNFHTWQRIFERVREGEMPPAKKPRPAPKENARFLQELEASLLAADRAAIAVQGRVLSRRLTRTEYAHTLHDLLGIDLPLRELLPEDPASHGFETVAEGQQLSQHQLARYLDVADLALEDAFRRAMKGDASYRKEFEPGQLSRRGSGNFRGPEIREGRSISWPITLQFFGRMPATSVPEDGWYRLTLREIQAINPNPDGVVWGTLRSGACASNAPVLFPVGLVEATATPRDLVFEAWIQKGHMLELKPNDATLNRAPTGATGGNVSFEGRDLERDGFAGIAHRGIIMERIYPVADRATIRHLLFGKRDLKYWESDPGAGLESLLTQFASRAFRRPVTPAILAPYLAIGRDALSSGGSLVDALRFSYAAVLCSPRFLTFTESRGRLDDHSLASRLSYALWCSMPDETLTLLAEKGRLSRLEVFTREFDRMIADPKSERFLQSFSNQWLNLKEIDFTSPDARQFPRFDPVLQESMVQETRAYLSELIQSDLPVTHLVDSSFTFLNSRLARHYRIPVSLPPGLGLQKVALPPGKEQVRGGFVTQAAVLKVTADGSATSPVVRGVFVNERLLGHHIPPPPPGIPAIEPDIRGATSIRDLLDKHRADASCSSCHQLIDPPGLALENFDPIGGWRERYGIGGKGVPIDPSGRTPQGDEFANVIAWKRIQTTRATHLARGFATHFLTYATGAPPRFSDSASLDAIVASTQSSEHGLRSLILASLASPVFQEK